MLQKLSDIFFAVFCNIPTPNQAERPELQITAKICKFILDS